jgi:hypothetical protein
MKLLLIITVGFDMADKPELEFVHSSNTGEILGVKKSVYALLIDFKKVCNSARKEVLCEILIGFG